MTSNSEIQALYLRARARNGAWSVVDPTHQTAIGRLGAIEHALSAQAISQKDADRQRDALLRDHVAWLRQIADAPEPCLHGLLYPPAPAVEITRAQRASHAIDQARREGIQLSSPRLGVIEAVPRSKIGQPLRDLLRDYADEISVGLRSEIETFGASTPEPASAT